MTEKRFTDDGIEDVENQSFTDNLTEKTYWIDHGLDEIVDLLNQLNDENKQLKLLTNYRGEMVSFATSIIQDMGSEEMLKMWNDFTEVMYQKWKKKRGIK